MSDTEDGPDQVNDSTSKDVELHNPNLIEESDEYEEVDDTEAEPFKDSPEEELKQASGQVDDDEDDDEDVTIPPVEGSYDPSDYDALDVDDETRELFGLIMKYTPQTVELDHKWATLTLSSAAPGLTRSPRPWGSRSWTSQAPGRVTPVCWSCT